MSRTHRPWQWLPAALAGLLLAGCSLFSPWKKPEPPAPPPVVEAPPPVPELPVPQALHRFELADADTQVVGAVQQVVASKEDTLPDIARRFNVGYEEIVRANPGVDPWLPGAGRRIVVPTRFVLPNAPHEGVVINLAALRLYYYPKHAKGEPQVVYTHPIGIGKVGWKTPEGVTKILSREKDPVWRPTAAVRKEHAENDDPVPAVVPAGPDNPLGKYKFTLGWQSYLIHGTNKPYGVGLRSSHGCIRLYPEDIERLYNSIPIGTQVRVVNQPYLFGWQNGELLLQAYSVLEDDKRNWSKADRALLAKSMTPQLQKSIKDGSVNVDWDAVSAVTRKPRGLPVRVSKLADGVDAGARAAADPDTVDAVVAGAPLVQNRIPQGSNWDGADDIERDEASYQQLLREREQPAPTASTPGGAGPLAPPAVTAPAAAPRTTAVAAPGARGSRG